MPKPNDEFMGEKDCLVLGILVVLAAIVVRILS